MQREFKDIQIGEKRSFTKTLTDVDIGFFVGITGDMNPLHVDEEFARRSMFKGRVVHGMLTASLLTNPLTQLLGDGGVHVSQNLKFLSPVRIGDTITAEVEVLEKNEITYRIKLKTTCKRSDGTLVLSGESTCLIPKPASP